MTDTLLEEMNAQSARLCRAFNPDHFVDQANATTNLLREHLDRAYREERVVWPDIGPEELLQQWPKPDSKPLGQFAPMVEEIIANSTCQNSPGFVGQQISMPPLLTGPVAMASAILNNSSAIYEGAPVAIALEHRIVQWMLGKVGWGEQAGGVLTSGGTLGALTAMLAMRQAKAGTDCWGEGLSEGNRYAVFVSEESHYCNRRACAIMGLGDKAAIPIATDERFRMRLDSLAANYERCMKEGSKPIAVVGNAGSTATGSHDDLNMLATFCEKRDLWFHVDAAHGGSNLLSTRFAPLLDGIDRADSLVWDAHKMMLMPSLCTAILVRDSRHLDSAFRQDAAYLLGEVESPWHQPASRNFETTKPTMVLPLYVALRTLGVDYFSGIVEYAFDLAQCFADEIERREEFEYLIRPEANIVCFRRIGGAVSDSDLNEIQIQLRDQINREGRFFIMRTTLRGKVWLRVVLMNPATTVSHLSELLNELAAIHLPGQAEASNLF